MIDEKKIEESARDYINKNGYFIKYDEGPCVDIEFAYKEGAKWAINEFLKDLWHDASEEPRKNNIYLAQIGDCAFDTFYDSKNWDTYSKGVNITRWLYIDDLLPR